MLVIPQDFSAFVALISNPLTAAIVLSIGIEMLPFIKSPKVADSIKLVFVVFVCLLWSVFISLLALTPGQSITPAWIYSVIALGLGVTFSTQVYHTIASNMPGLSAFLLALFGKSTTTTSSSTIDISTKTNSVQSPATPPSAPAPTETAESIAVG